MTQICLLLLFSSSTLPLSTRKSFIAALVSFQNILYRKNGWLQKRYDVHGPKACTKSVLKSLWVKTGFAVPDETIHRARGVKLHYELHFQARILAL